MIKTIGILVYTSFYSLFLQNLALCGGFGLSPLLRRASSPKHGVRYCLAVCWFSTVLSVLCGLLFRLPVLALSGPGVQIAVTGAVLLLSYLVTLLVVTFLFRIRAPLALAACAFNSLVMAVPLINVRLASPLVQGIGIGVGAGLSFALSVWLLAFGVQKLQQNSHIPRNFRGMPALFIYVGILSLAFTAVFGRAFMA